MPRLRNRHGDYLPKAANYSAHDVEKFLLEEQAKGFGPQPLPDGCNFQIVLMPKAVMRAYRQRELAWLKAKRAQK